MTNNRIQNLGSAILHWLCFQSLCGRNALLSESYLSQPVGEFLLYHHSGDLDAEVKHPNLSKEGKQGHPRQVDFCLFSRDTKRMTDAFELKWVADSSFDKDRIVDDLLRLEGLRIRENQSVDRYFIVAGINSYFEDQFRYCQANTREGSRIDFFADLLRFDSKEDLIVEISKLHAVQRAAFDKFASNYRTQLPARFFIALEYGQSMDGFSVFIWRVKSSKGRRPSRKKKANA